tara:strand:- start:522 stop:647 length:126 start_codon:yes stop_codon:yes gene_type:complete
MVIIIWVFVCFIKDIKQKLYAQKFPKKKPSEESFVYKLKEN